MKQLLQIAIQDANILIDLITIQLFDQCLSLRYRFITTDLILAELYDEQVKLIQPHIHSGKFSIISITPDELDEIQMLTEEDSRLSLQDWSAFHYAKELKAMLMTGDRRLRNLAVKRGVHVCGILRIFDELIDDEIITLTQACRFLKHLMEINSRLPSKECSARINKWCNLKN